MCINYSIEILDQEVELVDGRSVVNWATLSSLLQVTISASSGRNGTKYPI